MILSYDKVMITTLDYDCVCLENLSLHLIVCSILSKVTKVAWASPHLSGDLIVIFKIFVGFDLIMFSIVFFSLSSTGLRGHEFKRQKPQIHLDIRKHFFHLDVIEE